MAIVAVAKRLSVSVKLNAGIDPDTNKDLTKSLSLGSMSTGATPEQIMAVVNALTPCLTYDVDRTEQTEVKTLENNG